MMVVVGLGLGNRRRRLVAKPAPRRRFAAVRYIAGVNEGGVEFFCFFGHVDEFVATELLPLIPACRES